MGTLSVAQASGRQRQSSGPSKEVLSQKYLPIPESTRAQPAGESVQWQRKGISGITGQDGALGLAEF